jgi:hypothetical protein
MANFPTRKLSQNLNPLAFPNDLLANAEIPHMSIHFINYRAAFYGGTTVGGAISGLVGAASGTSLGQSVTNFINTTAFLDPVRSLSRDLLAEVTTGKFILPIPKKVNESQTAIWGETSLFDAIGGIPNLPVTSALTGFQVNPFQLLYFQRPAFREFSFSWTFSPNSPQESRTLRQIITEFKKNQLPTAIGPIFDYPSIAIIKFLPNDLNQHIKLKPCAIISVQIDHVGGPNPSFFKGSGGAPTLINVSMNLKEIDIQTTNDYTGKGVGDVLRDIVDFGGRLVNARNPEPPSNNGGTTPRNE